MTVTHGTPVFSPKKRAFFLKAYGQQLGIFELETLEWILKQQHPNRNTILESHCHLDEKDPCKLLLREMWSLKLREHKPASIILGTSNTWNSKQEWNGVAVQIPSNWYSMSPAW